MKDVRLDLPPIRLSLRAQSLVVVAASVLSMATSLPGPACAEARFVHAQRYETRGLGGAIASALSPDGRFLYVAGFTDSALAVFSRDPASGALTFRRVYYDDDAPLATHAARGDVLDDGLRNVVDVAISPDGVHLYTAAWGDDAIGIYRRQASGHLQYLAKAQVAGVLDAVSSLAMTSDGLGLWSASFDGASVCHFSRDPATGLLSGHGCTTDPALDGARSLVLADGESTVLVAAKEADTLVCLAALDQPPWIGGIGATGGLDGAYALDVAADGLDVYVGLLEGQALVHLRRLAGAQSQIASPRGGGGCYQTVQTYALGQGGKAGVWVDPRQNGVVVAGTDQGRLYRLHRDATTGALTDPVFFVTSLVDAELPVGLTGTPGGGSLYLSALSGHVLAFSPVEDSLPRFRHTVGGPEMPLLEALHDIEISVPSSVGQGAVFAVGEEALLGFRRDFAGWGTLTPFASVPLGVSSPWSLAVTFFHVYTAREGSGVVARHYLSLLPRGTDGTSLTSISDLATAPDGEQLYAVSDVDEALVVLSIASLDGALTEVQRIDAAGPPPFSGSVGMSGVAVAPDGSRVFVAAYGSQEVATFSRGATGLLTYLGSAYVGSSTTSQRARLAVSPDSRHVYAVGLLGDDLHVLGPAQVFGPASAPFVVPMESYRHGAARVSGVAAVQDVAVSGDGRQVVTAENGGTAAIYERDVASGALTLRRTLVDGDGPVIGLSGARAVAATLDGTSVYVAGHSSSGGFGFPTGAAAVLDLTVLFLDGFESGGTSAWSATTP